MPHPVRRARLLLALPVALPLLAAACVQKDDIEKASYAIMSGGPRPDVLPSLLTTPLPFAYPRELYAQKVQGNVTLRLYIDSTGFVHNDSTIIVESSGYGGLDSSAVIGSRQLRFTPAMREGKAMPVLILFPVYFRYPGAAPLPGDTILKKSGTPDAGRGTANPR
ncbi:MAG TPA: energy transducer TonB [Gemmatimonadaceae bacterium]|nr:energy transducer TonB [Gemmatimonadaceae bacterium]